jgi:uncharacterized protein with PQ loop repeat
MNNDLLKTIFGFLGFILGLIFGISPYTYFKKIQLHEINLPDIPLLMLIFNYLNNQLWLAYGILLKEFIMIFGNIINLIINIVFIIWYIYYYVDKQNKKCSYYSGILILISIFLFLILVNLFPEKLLGKSAMIFNILMFFGPCQNIFKVIKTGNYKLLSILSSSIGFVMSFCWVLYGVFIKNINSIIPNLFGVILCLIQILFYLIYKYKISEDKKYIFSNKNNNTEIEVKIENNNNNNNDNEESYDKKENSNKIEIINDEK